MIDSQSAILERLSVLQKHAYVIENRNHANGLNTLMNYLEEKSIKSAGRWGKWKFFSMEDSILDGFETANEVLASVEC